MTYHAPAPLEPPDRPDETPEDVAAEDREVREAARIELEHCGTGEFYNYLADGIAERSYRWQVSLHDRLWLRFVHEALVTGNDAQLGSMIRNAVTAYVERCERARR